jgi:hypothetical protein
MIRSLCQAGRLEDRRSQDDLPSSSQLIKETWRSGHDNRAPAADLRLRGRGNRPNP